MKVFIFLCTTLLLMSFDTDSSNSQNDFYFAKFGFDYQLIADPKIELLSLFNFEEISSHPIAKDKDFLNDYFHEIAQASNQLILLKKPGNEEDSEIYDINGKCISNLIYNKVFN